MRKRFTSKINLSAIVGLSLRICGERRQELGHLSEGHVLIHLHTFGEVGAITQDHQPSHYVVYHLSW